MDLIITTPGSYISLHDGIFQVSNREDKTTIAPSRVERVIITTHAAISTDAIKTCLENNIDLILIQDNGDVIGRFWLARFGSIAAIRRRQLELYQTEQGLAIALDWIASKLLNQINFIQDLAKNRPALADTLSGFAHAIVINREKLIEIKEKTLDDTRGTIQGLEGSASNSYFKALAMSIPERYHFEGRSRQPAKDPFNAFINYAYGILYAMVERACIIAGLDPYIGFIHTDNYNKPSLVYDIIENFRIYADICVFHLFSQKKIANHMVREIPKGYSLNQEGKKELFTAFNEYLDKIVHYGSKNMKRRQTIQAFCHRFANSLIEEGK